MQEFLQALKDNDSFTPDESGFWTLINIDRYNPAQRNEDQPKAYDNARLRVDIMTGDDEHVASVAGTARSLHKYLTILKRNGKPYFNPGHLAYIGFELGKAESALVNNLDYVQE
jgi:hypothetical protein